MERARQILVKRGSLTDGHEDVLVNASNTNIHFGYGVSKAIHRACGEAFQEYVRQEQYKAYRGPMPPGSILITNAGEHPSSKYVAHVAVMDYRYGMMGESHPDNEVLQLCYQNLWAAIETIDAPSPLSVAVVALGAGVGKISVQTSIELACRTVQAHLTTHPNSKLGDLVFYGYEQFEYIAMLEIASSHFTLSPDSVPQELRSYLLQAK